MLTAAQSFQKNLRRAFIAVILLVAVLALFFNWFSDTPQPSGTISLSQLLADAQKGKIAQIEIQRDDPRDLFVYYKNQPQSQFYTRIDNDAGIIELLSKASVPLDTLDVHVAPPPAWGGVSNTIAILLPLVVMAGFFILFTQLRRMQQRSQGTDKG